MKKYGLSCTLLEQKLAYVYGKNIVISWQAFTAF